MAYKDSYGVKFSAGRKTLISCPKNFKGGYAIPEGVTEIGHDAFYRCTGLKSIEIPDSVTKISDGAFVGCESVSLIKVSENNAVYDSRENCNAIIETNTNTLITGCKATVIPKSVTKIGESAFEDCADLTSITIPEGVAEIGNVAFNKCTGLKSIIIPEGVTKIGNSAFCYCVSLTMVNIPNSVKEIGEGAFEGCADLRSIICNAVTPPVLGEDTFAGVNKTIQVNVPKESIEEYKKARGWKEFTSIQCIAD